VFLLVVSRNNALRAGALASAQHKTRRGEPPGLRRNFGEYAFLEDSRYTSRQFFAVGEIGAET
jgi:hypothetical protein